VRRGPLPRCRAVIETGNLFATAPSFGTRPLVTTTFSFLSSRARDLAAGEVLESMNKTRAQIRC
jgi:hypothetical protein